MGHRGAVLQAQFYSDADWQRLRMELWYANNTLGSGRPSAQAWDAVQHGLSELLISPAVKRRSGIELRPSAVDEDENAAVDDRPVSAEPEAGLISASEAWSCSA